jgi:DNA-binding cell septation regulator SpoVG
MSNTEVRTERPGGGGSAAPAVRIDAHKVYQKNTLKGFIDFTLLDVGLAIHGASVHEKESRRWISMPSRSYTDAEGAHWTPIVEFVTREARDRINDAVLKALDAFSAGSTN